jgi:PadR family transcriptional regulator PadR
MLSADLKRGTLELLLLSLLEGRHRHGYEIGKLLEERSGGQVQFRVSTLYSILYRMEHRGWIKGRWIEKQDERRRCRYSLTPAGRAVMVTQRQEWRAFSDMVNEVAGVSHA